ncbi:MAG TPA: pirin family protein [Streptosporangiaceae bacterium]|nr:pirin family protein [Streptosporangiaceae bacterium]
MTEMTAPLRPTVDVRRRDERFTTRLSWLDVNNDDIVRPGTGFETHPHQDMEMVTWVLRGSLVHQVSHFVQMWVVPDSDGSTPGYEQVEIDDELLRGGLVPVASGMDSRDGASAIRIKNKYAALHAARLGSGDAVELPEAPFLHLFVPRGNVTLEGTGDLAEGDAVPFTATGGQRVSAAEPAEILVWEMHATFSAW